MSDSKPIGITLIGAIMLAFAVISILIAILLAAGNALIFDGEQPMWILMFGTGIGLAVAYVAIRIGLGLMRKPAEGREAGELAMWLGILIVWLAMAAINLLLTEGQDDVTALALVVPAGVLSSAVLIGAALYLRSQRVRSYFQAERISIDPGR